MNNVCVRLMKHICCYYLNILGYEFEIAGYNQISLIKINFFITYQVTNMTLVVIQSFLKGQKFARRYTCIV